MQQNNKVLAAWAPNINLINRSKYQSIFWMKPQLPYNAMKSQSEEGIYTRKYYSKTGNHKHKLYMRSKHFLFYLVKKCDMVDDWLSTIFHHICSLNSN